MKYRLESVFFGLDEVILYPKDRRNKWIEGTRFAKHKWYDLTDIEGDGFDEIAHTNKFISGHDVCQFFSILSVN